MKSIYLAVAGLTGLIGLGVIVYTMTSQPPAPKLQNVVRSPQVDDRRESPATKPHSYIPPKPQEAINDTDSWQIYQSSVFPFTFKYPPHSRVQESLEGVGPGFQGYEFLAIGGLEPEDKHSSWINIYSGADIGYYNPPLGTRVEQWVLRNPKYPFEAEYYKVDGDRMIGGVRALHIVDKRYGYHEYLLVKENRLYEILLYHEEYHTKGNPNQTVYDTFLDSISFTK